MVRGWLAGLGLAALLSFAACSGGAEYDVPAGQVQVVQNGEVLGQLPRAAGIDDLEERVQFDILQPAFVPEGGFRLVALEAQTPNAIEATGDDGRSNAAGVLLWMDGKAEDDGTSRIYLIQYSRTGEPPQGMTEAGEGPDGARFYYSAGEGMADAAWITPDRAFTLEASGPETPSQDDIRALFESLR